MSTAIDPSSSPDADALAPEDRYLVVSIDTHTGPYVRTDLRPYCESANLEQFDEFCNAVDRHMAEALSENTFLPIALPEGDFLRRRREQAAVAGIVDPQARLGDMNDDGVAAEVIFHGALNEQPIPFSGSGLLSWSPPNFGQLEAAGIRIYNRWLADFVSVEPHRHVGTAHIPIGDIDAAVREVEWAREHGLTAVNLPAPRRDFPSYLDEIYEPLWAACAANDMVLNTHAGAGDSYDYPGPGRTAVFLVESMFFARRAMPMLVFGGVFERHPNLKLVLTEQAADWVPEAMSDMQSAYYSYLGAEVRRFLPREPIEYFLENVFVGASFMAHHEALLAMEKSLVDRFMWGSDYPHVEGCWPNTLESLRYSFHDIPSQVVAKLLGENAVQVYDLDPVALRQVADRVGPTVADVAVHVEHPAVGDGLAFRRYGKFA